MPNTKRTYSVASHEIVARRIDNHVCLDGVQVDDKSDDPAKRARYTLDYALPRAEKYRELREVLEAEAAMAPGARPTWSLTTYLAGVTLQGMVVAEVGDRTVLFVPGTTATARAQRGAKRARSRGTRVKVADDDDSDGTYDPEGSSDDDSGDEEASGDEGAAAAAPYDADIDETRAPKRARAAAPARPRARAAAAPTAATRRMEAAIAEVAGIVYVVKMRSLNNRFYYVGSTGWGDGQVFPRRLQDHVCDQLNASSGRLLPDGEAFTSSIVEFASVGAVPGEDPKVTLSAAENKRTACLMNEHGFASVRGGVFCLGKFGAALPGAQAGLAQSMLNLDYSTGLPFGAGR